MCSSFRNVPCPARAQEKHTCVLRHISGVFRIHRSKYSERIAATTLVWPASPCSSNGAAAHVGITSPPPQLTAEAPSSRLQAGTMYHVAHVWRSTEKRLSELVRECRYVPPSLRSLSPPPPARRTSAAANLKQTWMSSRISFCSNARSARGSGSCFGRPWPGEPCERLTPCHQRAPAADALRDRGDCHRVHSSRRGPAHDTGSPSLAGRRP